MKTLLAALSLLTILFSARAWADCPSAGSRAVTLKSVSDGDTFFTVVGEEVDLDGVLVPGSGGEKIGTAQSNEARAALADLLKQGAISLAFAGQEKDRYGRLKAQVLGPEMEIAWPTAIEDLEPKKAKKKNKSKERKEKKEKKPRKKKRPGSQASGPRNSRSED